MRRLSLNARLAQDATATAEVQIALFFIDHPMLDSPVRLSTDPTVRLSVDPLMYGTRSTWMTANPTADPFLFVLVSTVLPSDIDDAPASGNIIIENMDNDIAKLLRSFSDLASIHMAVVLASSPNLIEVEYRDMSIVSSDIEAGEVSVAFSRDDIELEYYPTDRMTKNQFPGLHR